MFSRLQDAGVTPYDLVVFDEFWVIDQCKQTFFFFSIFDAYNKPRSNPISWWKGVLEGLKDIQGQV